MKPTEDKIYKFAARMSEQLFEMRSEDIGDSIAVNDYTFNQEYANKILADPKHVKAIKFLIKNAVIAKIGAVPEAYLNHERTEYVYCDDVYDHAYHMDEYIQKQYDEEREAKLIKKWLVKIEIERIETNPDDPMDEDYFDEVIPIGIAHCNSLEAAHKLRDDIIEGFGNNN